MGVETVFHALTKFNENHSGELKKKFLNKYGIFSRIIKY